MINSLNTIQVICFMKHIFDRKDVQVIIFGSYNVKKHGELHQVCFKSKRCDAKKKILIKDIVRNKKLVFEQKSWFFSLNIACGWNECLNIALI